MPRPPLVAGLWICLVTMACKQPTDAPEALNYRDAMARFVADLSTHARRARPDFAVVLQNGHEILFTGADGGAPRGFLVDAVDGVARESPFFGYPAVDDATPAGLQTYMLDLLRRAQVLGLTALSVDYCRETGHVDEALRRARLDGFLPFAAQRRELDTVPDYPAAPVARHAGAVSRLPEARNFLYLINPGRYPSADSLVADLSRTAYDLLIVDAFFGETMLTPSQVAALQRKPGGARRLVLSYLSIGEAEAYRDYFDPEWLVDPPPWLAAENPDWAQNFKVRYWDPDWQAIVFGSEDAYLDRIVAAGFDGAYLDIVDAFAYFEARGG